MSKITDQLVNSNLCRNTVSWLSSHRLGRPLILFYHGVSVEAVSAQKALLGRFGDKHLPLDSFVTHLKTLKKSWRVIELNEMVAGLRAGDEMRGTIAITFDDGYENNVLKAAPVLADFNVPASFFIATDFIGTNKWIWTDHVEVLIRRTKAKNVFFAPRNISFSLASEDSKNIAINEIKAALKGLGNTEKLAWIQVLGEELGDDLNDAPVGDQRFMSWDQVRSLSQSGFEVGGHTMSHPILSRLPFDEAKNEILGCCERIKRELGKCSPIFCYPNGKSSDYTKEIMEFCAEHFDSAVSTNRGPARADELFELRRLGTPKGARLSNIDWLLFTSR